MGLGSISEKKRKIYVVPSFRVILTSEDKTVGKEGGLGGPPLPKF